MDKGQDTDALALSCAGLLKRIQDPPLSLRVKDAVKRLLGRGGAMSEDPLFWPAGFLLMGLAAHALRSPNGTASRRAVESYLHTWRKRCGEPKNIDDALAGAAAVILCKESGEEDELRALCLSVVRGLSAFMDAASVDPAGSYIYHPAAGNACIFADGAGMAAFYLSAMAKEGFGEADGALDRARLQLDNFLKYGIDDETGLPYHGYLHGAAYKLGLVGWGRAVGFLLMGMSAYVEAREGDDVMSEAYYAMTENVLRYQRGDGGFSWLLPARAGHPDTSATAMIGIGLGAAVRRGRRGAMEGSLAIKEFLGSRIMDGVIGDCLAECRDFGEHPQVFGVYPWGMGASLYFLMMEGMAYEHSMS